MHVSRRAFLASIAAGVGAGTTLAHHVAGAAPAPFEIVELEARGRHASRATLLVPRHAAGPDEHRLLVALHGLGEAHDERVGIRAWLDRYGLGSAYERLLAPPIAPMGKRGEWTQERLVEVNASLAKRPFGGLAVVCPFTPSFKGVADRASALTDYADWLVGALVPEACRIASVRHDPSMVGIDGCSMGGPHALDTFLRHPGAFGSLGVVQPAFGLHRVEGYAERLAASLRGSPHAVQLLSSRGDPFVEPTTALARALEQRGVRPTLRVLPGPHDQPWLREAGTIEMLLFHERGPTTAR
jgi:hypothetical protein